MSQAAPDNMVALRCVLGYEDLDTFVAQYGRNVSTRGIFLPALEPPPVGTPVRFEVVLSDGQLALRGEGLVVWQAPPDPTALDRVHGMAVRFLRLDAESRAVIERVVAYKAANPSGFYTPSTDPLITTVPQAAPPAPERPAAPVAPRQEAAAPVVPAVVPAPAPVIVPAPVVAPAPRNEEEELAALARPASPPPLPPVNEASRLLEQLLSRRR